MHADAIARDLCKKARLFRSGYVRPRRLRARETRRGVSTSLGYAPSPLVDSALHTKPRRAAARGFAALMRFVRELRERETFALRAVTLAVTVDMVLGERRATAA